jgi:hypothetical protein
VSTQGYEWKPAVQSGRMDVNQPITAVEQIGTSQSRSAVNERHLFKSVRQLGMSQSQQSGLANLPINCGINGNQPINEVDG